MIPTTRRMILPAAILAAGVAVALVATYGIGRFRTDSSPAAAEEAKENRSAIAVTQVEEFLALPWQRGLSYVDAHRLLTPGMLPTILRMLDDPSYADQWGRLSTLVGFLGNDPACARALLAYVRRDDELSRCDLTTPRGFHVMIGKANALRWVGKMGDEESLAVLRSALTETGARQLASRWIGQPLPEPYDEAPERLIASLRGRAAIGLLYAGRPEDADLVENIYRAEHELCSNQRIVTPLYNELVSAMAERDLIHEYGLEGVFQMHGTNDIEVVRGKAAVQYSWLLAEMLSPAPPNP